ncbi:MAG: histidine phosphatase family protein [Thermomicrobiales bacterium]|nr:histidine phosphatase family protein [Thermomicrobiales bacterium]MCO5218796.1 histidine phosphatase family protein [Thermomicrobiales bacterium]MCO5225497.1 histidine phosphatase family protein [Thermomicrobiales bacterium]MCO5229085.1 histidine phosphatase family protein [Thermomicrobiales bacterium]
MTTEFVLIRHGQTNWNIDHRYQGISKTPLNQTGLSQARALADAVRGERFDVMASSPLPRAWDTALPVADATDFARDLIIPDDRLIERYYGVAEGYTLAERQELYPGDIWEGLEPFPDLEVRSMAAMTDYLERFTGQRIALVTHGTWISSVLQVITHGEYGYGKVMIANTSRTFLTYDGDGWRVGEISVLPEGVPAT